jgi:hypothetical protein
MVLNAAVQKVYFLNTHLMKNDGAVYLCEYGIR